MSERIRILVVDDSMVMRKMIERLVAEDAAIEVVGTAANGKEAIAQVQALRPDVVTMDVRMPVMDGLEALRHIMAECPTPVIMLSAATEGGADETLQALAAGAVDFVSKGEGGKPRVLQELGTMLITKLHSAANARVSAPRAPRAASRSVAPRVSLPPSLGSRHPEILLIGSSTGGPNALQEVLVDLPADLPVGVLIVQHMPPTFTTQLARRLDRLCALQVKEAEDGDAIRPGQVLLSPGDRHLVVRKAGEVSLEAEPSDHLHIPAVDVLMESAGRVYGDQALAVILTGMGQDGSKGIEVLKARGGVVIAQDEETCVVYGMPRAVVEAGLADAVAPLDEIGVTILSALGYAPGSG